MRFPDHALLRRGTGGTPEEAEEDDDDADDEDEDEDEDCFAESEAFSSS